MILFGRDVAWASPSDVELYDCDRVFPIWRWCFCFLLRCLVPNPWIPPAIGQSSNRAARLQKLHGVFRSIRIQRCYTVFPAIDLCSTRGLRLLRRAQLWRLSFYNYSAYCTRYCPKGRMYSSPLDEIILQSAIACLYPLSNKNHPNSLASGFLV
jgi:hypothetical protein